MNHEIVDGARKGMRNAWDATEVAASDARSTVTSAAVGARSRFFDALEKLTKIAAAARAFGLNDALVRVGLQRRRSIWADVGVFGAGFVAGAAVTALATPVSGRALRRKLGGMVIELADGTEQVASATAKRAGAQVGAILHDVREVAAHEVGAAKQAVAQVTGVVATKIHDVTDTGMTGDTRPSGVNDLKSAAPQGRN